MASREDRTAHLSCPRILARAAILVGAPALATALLLWLPWPALRAFTSDPSGSRITDARGALMGLVPGTGGAFQERVSRADYPPRTEEIFVKLEDERFRFHPGVDPFALARAAADAPLGRGGRSGASTITMQLARMVSPHPRSFLGKAVEMANALRLESRLTKDEILSLYLSFVPFGRNARGIGAAAWTYFGCDVSALSSAQLLALAIVPRNPTLYDPFEHPDALIAEAARIARSKTLGIAAGEIARAVRGARQGRPPGSAPHYARYIAGEVLAGRVRAVNGEVRTTLDSSLNDYILGRIRFHLGRYSTARITNAAVVVIDNATGAVRGWVGSRDFTDSAAEGQIDGVLVRRQSASTLKPFLYARAIEKGWTAATLLPDVPIVFGAADEEAYRPENFDNRSHGVVRLRTALASSLNVPAVYTLSRVGLSDFLGTLGRLGFALPVDAQKQYGLGAAIGNAEVTLLELTRAFSVFPRGGTLPEAGGSRRVFDPFAAWMICSILSDPSARATGFGTRTYFRTQYPAMFKTGTSSEFTNLWCVGATPRYTVGSWAGNFDGRAVINKTGSVVPTQIVVDALDWITSHDARPAVSFARPGGIVQAKICTLSGQRATASCPSVRTEYFRSEADVPQPCQYHAGSARNSALRDAFLLEESFLGAHDAVKILFPADRQVFYADETLRAGEQGIPVSVASRAGSEVSVTYDGSEVAHGAPLPPIELPLRKGVHSIVARTADGSDRVLFEVR